MKVAVELDPAKAATFSANHPKTEVLGHAGSCGDVRQTKGEKLMKLARLGHRRLDLLVACPPCQGFSTIGKRDPQDPRNKLYLEFVRLAREMSPKAVVFENVPGIQRLYRGTFLDNLTKKLKELGYKVATWRLLASDLGVPQHRERIFVVGLRRRKPGRPPNKRKKVFPWEALADVPTSKSGVDNSNPKHRPLKYRRSSLSKYARQLRGTNTTVTACRLTRHDPDLVDRFRLLKWGEKDPSTNHRRMHPNSEGPTITAGTRSMTACRPVHPYADRVLTVREAARLTSFPDWYQFPPEVAEAWSQIGNSVPPLMAKAVFQRVRTFLEA